MLYNDTYPYRLTSSMQATQQQRRNPSQGEQMGAELLAGRHSFWVGTECAMPIMQVLWRSLSPDDHSLDQAS